MQVLTNSGTFNKMFELTARVVSSAVERPPYKRRVGGSNPSLPTKITLFRVRLKGVFLSKRKTFRLLKNFD